MSMHNGNGVQSSRDGASAAHQALRREVNEQIREVNTRFISDGPGTIEVMCECSHLDCAGRIELDRDLYEQVRRFPTRFLVKEGHELGEIERIVADGRGYVIVEKAYGTGSYAVATDPRRRRPES